MFIKINILDSNFYKQPKVWQVNENTARMRCLKFFSDEVRGVLSSPDIELVPYGEGNLTSYDEY